MANKTATAPKPATSNEPTREERVHAALTSGARIGKLDAEQLAARYKSALADLETASKEDTAIGRIRVEMARLNLAWVEAALLGELKSPDKDRGQLWNLANTVSYSHGAAYHLSSMASAMDRFAMEAEAFASAPNAEEFEAAIAALKSAVELAAANVAEKMAAKWEPASRPKVAKVGRAGPIEAGSIVIPSRKGIEVGLPNGSRFEVCSIQGKAIRVRIEGSKDAPSFPQNIAWYRLA